MRDVSNKIWTQRTARAKATLIAAPSTIVLIQEGKVPKGDPIPISKVAAIQAAKNTSAILPYCHQVQLDFVGVEFTIKERSIEVIVETKGIYKTGFEMEALTGAAAAVLNLYDMLKMLDEEMHIAEVVLLDKTGGKSNFTERPEFRAAVIVVSDSVSAGQRDDLSGKVLEDGLKHHGAVSTTIQVVPDDAEEIDEAVVALCKEGTDFVLLTGGTGIGPRDTTPEAILPILDRRLPGIELQFLNYSRERQVRAMFSRTVAGQIGNSLVISLPGSPSACRDALDSLFPYVLHFLFARSGKTHDGGARS